MTTHPMSTRPEAPQDVLELAREAVRQIFPHSQMASDERLEAAAHPIARAILSDRATRDALLKEAVEVMRPFAKNPGASSLARVYAHLTRNDARNAHALLEKIWSK